MELETHVDRISRVIDGAGPTIELSNRVTNRINETWGLGVFHPETFKSMGQNVRLIGRMAYELVLLAPHTAELLKIRNELRNRNDA